MPPLPTRLRGWVFSRAIGAVDAGGAQNMSIPAEKRD